MGVEPPFIYDRPSAYSFSAPTDRGFNPRSATHASWSPKVPRTPKKDGPLIDFNRHPDSYLIVPYGNLNVTPMNPNTKKKVARARYTQLCLRVLQLFGALGLLFCVIAINKTSTSVGWIIRLAPGVALIHTVYGVYHFCRKAAARTPGSTASYMLFAAMIDTGLVPFFVFSALMSHQDYSINAYGWSTLFNTSEMSYKIIYAFFVTCVVEGGLLIISLVLGVYLALLFRKIAKLPPDMNPLEPNLTARPHKRNKSEFTSEKHLSGATVSSDSLIAGTRRVPFMHTRTDSADSITLYNNSPRQSKQDLGLAKDDLYRRSNLSLAEANVSRPASAINPLPNARFAGAGLENSSKREISPDRASKTSSWLSYLDFEGVPTPISEEAERTLDEEVQYPDPVSTASSQQGSPNPSRESRNWFNRSARNSQVDLSETIPLAQAQSARASMVDITESLKGPKAEPTPKKRSREPLAMNPPTPTQVFANQIGYYTPVDQYQDENISIHDQYYEPHQPMQHETRRQVLHDTDANHAPRPRQTSRPSSFVGSGGKSRFYGDLRSSIGSFNNNDHKKNDDVADSVSDYSRTQTMETNSTFVISNDADSDDGIGGSNYVTYPAQPVNQQGWNGARQVSNSTGYDLNSGYAGLGAEFGRGMGRRREVSGKVAEEGRGYGGFGAPETEAGVVTGQNRAGAAGWARFKGL